MATEVSVHGVTKTKKFIKIVVNFIWDKGRSKIAYTKLCIQSCENGGLKLVDLGFKDVSLKAAWVRRLLYSNVNLYPLQKLLPCTSVRSNLAMHLSDTPVTIRQPIQRPCLLERIYKPICILHWCGVLPLRALEIGCK